MKLTDAQVKRIKRPGKHADGGGLTLLVRQKEHGLLKLWRFRYRIGKTEKMLSFGQYPTVTLARAREKLLEAKRLLDKGEDPSVHKRREREATADTFKAIQDEWLAKQANLSESTVTKAKWLLGFAKSLEPRPIRDITPQDVLRVLRKVEADGRHETAHRTKMRLGQIWRYAVATGRADFDVTQSLRGALAPVVTESHAAITDPKRFGELLRAVWGYQGQPSTMAALKLAPLVFLRPGELRGGMWSEITLDGDEPLWRVPAARMKMKREHVVPLSKQAVEILRALHPITGSGDFVFPGGRPRRCLSENGLRTALITLGFDGKVHTTHGFRTSASSMLHELGHDPHVIELQLAHRPGSKVAQVYNRAERVAERRKMMQAWADYCDELRDPKSNVVAIKGKRA